MGGSQDQRMQITFHQYANEEKTQTYPKSPVPKTDYINSISRKQLKRNGHNSDRSRHTITWKFLIRKKKYAGLEGWHSG